MPEWLTKLFEGWPMIRANLPTFVLIVVFVILAVWWVVNWSYATVLASKTGQIEIQDRQLADYKAKLEGATPDQAKARIDALEARLAGIEPRRLTGPQRATLTVNLRQSNNYRVFVTSEMSGDSPQFAADISGAFREAGGWTISEPSVMGIGNRPPTGIAIRYSDLNKPPVEATVIEKSLRAAGIQFDVQQGANPGTNVEMLICTRIVR